MSTSEKEMARKVAYAISGMSLPIRLDGTRLMSTKAVGVEFDKAELLEKIERVIKGLRTQRCPEDAARELDFNIESRLVDNGIGSYEFWGDTGVHHSWEEELDEQQGTDDIRWHGSWPEERVFRTSADIGESSQVEIDATINSLMVEEHELSWKLTPAGGGAAIKIRCLVEVFEASISWKTGEVSQR